MKSILLCIAVCITLFFAQAAYAQDTTYNPLKDSLSVDTSTVADTAVSPVRKANQLRRDSVTQARITDSIHQARLSGAAKDSTRKDSALQTTDRHTSADQKAAAPDSNKIVDIFEEMAAARDRQEQNIKKEAARQQAEKKEAADVAERAESQQINARRQIDAQIEKAKVQAQRPHPTDSEPENDGGNNKADRRDSTGAGGHTAGKDSLYSPSKKADSNATDPLAKSSTDQVAKKGINGQSKNQSEKNNRSFQNSQLLPGKDSAGVTDTSNNTMTVKRDTIQSIFTLPSTAQPYFDSAQNNAHQPEAQASHEKDQRVKDSLDQLFAATSAAARPDSLKMAAQNTDSSKSAVAAATPNQGKEIQEIQKTQETNETKETKEKTATDLKDRTAAGVSGDSTQKAIKKAQGDSSQAHNALSRNPMDSSQPSEGTRTFTPDSLAAKNTPFTDLFRPYRTFNKQTNITSTTSLTILQQNVDYKTSADFTTRYQRTGERDGDFLFDVSVVKLNTEVETMGVQLKYDSNKKTDSTSTFAKPLFDIVGKRTFIQVDSTGKITGIDSSALGRQVNTVLSGLSLSGGDFEVGSNFGLLISKPVIPAVGQQWTDSVTHGGNKRVTTYKVQSVLDGDLLVTISGTVSQAGEITSDGAVFKTHFTGTQQGKMYVEQRTLLVKSRSLTLNMKGTVDYNGQSLPASAVSKIKEEVTAD